MMPNKEQCPALDKVSTYEKQFITSLNEVVGEYKGVSFNVYLLIFLERVSEAQDRALLPDYLKELTPDRTFNNSGSPSSSPLQRSLVEKKELLNEAITYMSQLDRDSQSKPTWLIYLTSLLLFLGGGVLTTVGLSPFVSGLTIYNAFMLFVAANSTGGLALAGIVVAAGILIMLGVLAYLFWPSKPGEPLPLVNLKESFELVKDDEEPSEGRGWRAKQPACPAVKPFVVAASPDAADAGRLRPSAAGGHASAETEGERATWTSRFAS